MVEKIIDEFKKWIIFKECSYFIQKGFKVNSIKISDNFETIASIQGVYPIALEPIECDLKSEVFEW